MPRKTHILTDEERAKRIRETAKEIGTSNDPEDFERAFRRVVHSEAPPPQSVEKRKTGKKRS
jgi:hypothetical protein